MDLEKYELLTVYRYGNFAPGTARLSLPQHFRIPAGCLLADDGATIKIYREKPIAWDGEGVPPEGTECEVSHAEQFFTRARITHVGRALVAWQYLTGDPGQHEYADEPRRLKFRPIRTPEQIEADKRESAIREITERFALFGHPGVPWAKLFAQMYDSGVLRSKNTYQ